MFVIITMLATQGLLFIYIKRIDDKVTKIHELENLRVQPSEETIKNDIAQIEQHDTSANTHDSSKPFHDIYHPLKDTKKR